MVKNALLCLALVSTGVVGASVELGVNYASAADPKGSRWYYHIDRATNRKCWFLMKVTTAPATAQTRRRLPRSDLARTPPELEELSTAGQTGQRGKHKLSEAEQAALFLEFLRWRGQNVVNSNAAESLRGTIKP